MSARSSKSSKNSDSSRAMTANAVVVAMGCCLSWCVSAGGAPVTVFHQDLSGFNTAAGNPAIAVDFDNITAGTDIGGQTINGAKFIATGSPLIVVAGADTQTTGAYSGIIDASTNKLLPTSGANVLSPGGATLGPGPDPAIEDDGVNIVLDNPVSAFGLDHLSQSADGFSFTTVSVFDDADVQLFTELVPISGAGGGPPGAADFWGIVSDTANIKRVQFTEGDADSTFPDNNIGFDTLRFGTEISPPPPPPTGIPLPAAAYSAPMMLAAGAWAKRKLRF